MSFRDVASDVARWRGEGKPIALATVVATWGSGPRGPGAKMALTENARIAGSVSGGCVEAAVVDEAREVLETGAPKLLRFGVADETAWEVGLSCGGSLEVFVEKLDDAVYEALKAAVEDRTAVARATIVEGEGLGRSVLLRQNDAPVPGNAMSQAARAALEAGRPERTNVDGAEVFIDVELPPPVLILVGGVHIAIALTTMAKSLGYRSVVVDPRGVFGSEERFAHADELVQEWPDDALNRLGIDRSTAVATLTHDPKLDDPALAVALRSDAFYVGALGSRRTHEKRLKRLRQRGVSESELERLRAPIGLGIGSRTPEEIALSVMAEVVAVRNQAA